MTTGRASREAMKKKIVLAAIRCIESEGMGSVTTRRVAREAGVNSAAINYYFGSKDELLREVFHMALGHFLEDVRTILNIEGLSIYSLLKLLLLFLLQGVKRYPNLMRALIFSDKEDYWNGEEEFFKELRRLLEKLIRFLLDSGRFKDEETVLMSLVQIFSAVIFPLLPLSLPYGYLKVYLEKYEEQTRYIDNILSRYINREGEIDKEEEKIKMLISRLFDSFI